MLAKYIKLVLYEDDNYEPEPITEEEFVELLRRDILEDDFSDEVLNSILMSI